MLITPLLFSLISCGNIGSDGRDYITFKDYVEIVSSASENEKNVFVFTSSSCPHCHAIQPLLTKYIRENTNDEFQIHELNVDSKSKGNNERVFKDKTMGYLSGNSENDCIKRLDNRISLYVKTIAESEYDYFDKGLVELIEGKYSYVATPLMLFYQGNIEVRIVNNVSAFLTTNNNNEYTYESFESFMEYPSDMEFVWNKEFDLTYYSG